MTRRLPHWLRSTSGMASPGQTGDARALVRCGGDDGVWFQEIPDTCRET
jgi:hypothetical protein